MPQLVLQMAICNQSDILINHAKGPVNNYSTIQHPNEPYQRLLYKFYLVYKVNCDQSVRPNGSRFKFSYWDHCSRPNQKVTDLCKALLEARHLMEIMHLDETQNRVDGGGSERRDTSWRW